VTLLVEHMLIAEEMLEVSCWTAEDERTIFGAGGVRSQITRPRTSVNQVAWWIHSQWGRLRE